MVYEIYTVLRDEAKLIAALSKSLQKIICVFKKMKLLY